MTKLPVRLTLLLACVAAIGYAAFVTWSSDQRLRINDAASRQITTTARGTTAGIAQLRAAQQAYVAVGQGEDFWIARVASLVADLHGQFTTLKNAVITPEAAAAMDEAVGALHDFEQMDRRARDYARGRQLAQASDLVFTDGFDLTKKAGDGVERAVVAELVAADAAAASHRRRQAYALAGAAVVALLSLLMLLPVKRKRDVEQTYVEIGDRPARPVSAEALEDLQDFGVVTKAVTAVQPDPRTRSQVDIGGMAALCVELARIQDTRLLPSLLARAADILRASGIVLWIADPDGRELTPIVVHGYPPNLALRFGTIVRDAENVTASAYRTGLLQVMKADPISNGAVAAPLVTSGGCVGVMAAEMKNGGEQQEALLAAAAIVAAQLATLVGPPAARARTEAAG